MTPEESRETFIDAQFTAEELQMLKDQGLYQDYVEGSISINAIYAQMREQGI
jgi:hypothetical protein